MSNKTTWQSLGWRITRKILFYIVAAAALWFGASFAIFLMNQADSIIFWLGVFTAGGVLGFGITFLLRELQFYFGGNNQNKQNKNENNETDY